ncbi:hypothetical protein D3C81_1566470 [compost metagenome]
MALRSSDSSSRVKAAGRLPFCSHSVMVISGGFFRATGTTGRLPMDLRSRASTSSAFLAEEASTISRPSAGLIQAKVLAVRLNARGSRECSSSSLSASFSFFLRARPCSVSMASISSASASLTTEGGRILSSLRAQMRIWPSAEWVRVWPNLPSGRVQPKREISWLPQGVKAHASSWVSSCSAVNSNGRVKR